MPEVRGFTLVELLMVMVVIGILAAVLGPRFFDRRDFDERLFYEESLAAVRYGQKLALTGGCSIRARVGAVGYALTYAQACAGVAVGGPVRGPSGDPFSAGNPQAVAVSNPGLNVVFDALGSASGSSNVSFGDGTFAITVHPATGFIETRP